MNKMHAVVAGLLATALIAGPAEARVRVHTRTVEGANGHGYSSGRSVVRGGGSATVSRGFQTNSGRGASTTRGHTASDGVYSGGATHTTNNGTSWGRTTTASANGDGTADYSTTFNGPSGGSATVSGTVSHGPN